MLNVLRFAGVFKKLQLNDLTKYLIGRLEAAERTAIDNASHSKQTRESHSLQQRQHQQSETPARSHLHQQFGTKSASAALAGSGGGLAFGNCSTLTTDRATSARASVSVNAQQHQQTVARELEENIEVSDCDQVMENVSTTAKHQQLQAEAIKAVAAAAAAAAPSSSASSSSSRTDTCPGASSPADIIKFLELVGSLKHIKRTGWVMRDVQDCESISGHMYRMGMMTYLLVGRDDLDRTKCLELAMVHDLAECVVGDITPFCGVSREEKKMRELQAMDDICKLIQPFGKKVLELFEEYENAQTPEAKFVKDLDRLDMVLQAFEYEKRDNCVMKHQEFFDSTDGKFEHPFVQQLVDEIYAQRRLLASESAPSMSISNGATTNGFTNGHHSDNDIMTTENCGTNGHDEDISSAKKASTS